MIENNLIHNIRVNLVGKIQIINHSKKHTVIEGKVGYLYSLRIFPKLLEIVKMTEIEFTLKCLKNIENLILFIAYMF